ncbi:MAG: DUF1365 domain-containing protein [Burkholderiales bacterium]|nr:DUF1365 domain-containing protein [Opitutaceae bacterium]
MLSRLYECRIVHARFHPRAHRFAYNVFFLALDLDELPALAARLRILRIDRPGLLSFRQADYLPTHTPLHNPSPVAAPSSPPKVSSLPAGAGLRPHPSPTSLGLKTRVLAHLATHGITPGPDARVLLLTLPRVLGYQFNPVSFYFISTADGRPVASMAEVTNTFRETKLYVLGPDTLQPVPEPPALPPSNSGSPLPAPSSPLFHLRVPKHFYVSPFFDVDVAFDFRLRPPGDRLALQIDDYEGALRTLLTTVANTSPPRALRDRTLAWFSLKYPLVTLKVISAIHWEALRLWLKRVPWFAKSARAADQRDLHHPHASLVPPPAENLPPASSFSAPRS